MKIKFLLLTSLLLLIITLVSFSSGVAVPPNPQNLTGAGGSSGNCSGSGCHVANNTDLSVNISLFDLVKNMTVTDGKYTPGNPYQVRISAYTSNGTFPKFSYQFAAEQQNGLGAGNYFSTPGLQMNVVGFFEIVEPFQPITTIGFLNFRDTINWIAPPKGSGNITLHTTLLASNQNGFATGDRCNHESRVYSEGTTSISETTPTNEIYVTPNPVKNNLQIIGFQDFSYSQIEFINLNGQKITLNKSKLDKQFKATNIDLSDLASGIYILHINISKDDYYSKPIFKTD